MRISSADSPILSSNADLFKRAILMSGSAMSADAIGKAPLQITKQVKKTAIANEKTRDED